MKINRLTSLLKESVKPALGCTEPIAIAYALAAAKDKVNNEIKEVELIVSLNIYKNAARVGIPGTEAKGPMMAAALSLIMGDAAKELEVIEGVEAEDIKAAEEIIASDLISLKVRDDIKGLYIESRVKTSTHKARVIIADDHLNIVKIEKINNKEYFANYQIENNQQEDNFKEINQFSLAELLEYVDTVALEDIQFLKEGVEMNIKVAEEALAKNKSLSSTFKDLIETEFLSDNLVSRARMLASAASEARMTGSKLPIMSSAGSGNQGIVNFITNYAAAEELGLKEEKLIRALALSNLITLYIKAATGSLSAMCGVAVAAGVGVSASTAYLMGGEEEEIFAAMLNVLGTLTGMVCDGAKEGCAYKVAAAAGWSIIAAKLAVEGKVVADDDGILADNFTELVANLAHLCNPGMLETDQAILDVMTKENNKAANKIEAASVV